MAAVGERGARRAPGALDLYRALVGDARTALDAVRRRRIALAVEISLVALYVLLRTFDASRPLLSLWVAAVLAVAVVSPVSGLVLLAAIAPFSEPFTITRQLGVKPLIVVALAAGVTIRVAAEVAGRVAERRGTAASPAVPVFGALRGVQRLAVVALSGSAVVLVGTALGVVESRVTFGRAFGEAAAETWLAGIGGGLILLVVATWAGATGAVRPAAVAVASAVVGAVVSLLDFLAPSSIRGAAFEWLLRPDRFEARLTGIIPSPNGVAALLIVPAGVLAATAVLARDLRLRLVSAAAAIVVLAALYFTYSRAALLGIFLIVVVVVWRVRQRAGMVLLVAGIVAGLVLLPTYLRARNGAVGNEGNVAPGDLLVASDALRFTAWGSAGRMWLDAPLTGHGFMSYLSLHEAYGDPILRSPHNEWLRLFAEEGVVTGLAAIVFVLATIAVLARTATLLTTGALAGFIGLAVAATFNNPFLFVQVLATAFTIVGVAVGSAITRRRDDSLPAGSPGSAASMEPA